MDCEDGKLKSFDTIYVSKPYKRTTMVIIKDNCIYTSLTTQKHDSQLLIKLFSCSTGSSLRKLCSLV